MACLPRLGENVRRYILSPLPASLKVVSPEKHTPSQPYVVTTLGILVQNVVSYDPGQPFITTQPLQNLPYVSNYPINSMTRGKSHAQVVSTIKITTSNGGKIVALGKPVVSSHFTTKHVVIPSSVT